MKKYTITLLMAIIIHCPVFTQNAVFTGTHYTVRGDNLITLERIAANLDRHFDIYNALFRFDTSSLTSGLNVRIFSERDSYNSYIMNRVNQHIDHALYIHFAEEQNRELVIFLPENYSGNNAELENMIAHQSFIQYLRAFIPNPPFWIINGFANYYGSFESRFNEYDVIPSVQEILSFDSQEARGDSIINNYKNYSWALVSFLLSGEREYYRILAESFLLMSGDNSAAQNTEILKNRFLTSLNMEIFQSDFRNYVFSYRSFNDLIEEGLVYFNMGNYIFAERVFLRAMGQDPENYIPYYYLGLIAYNAERYEEADVFFRTGLLRERDSAVLNYALGINSLALGHNDEAAVHLHLATGLNPVRFRLPVEEILRQLWR